MVNYQLHRATIGILIGDVDSRNKGFGTEVVGLMLRYCFEQLNCHSVHLTANGDNARALRCYEKNGFKVVGRERDCTYYNGHYCDTVHMDILRDEWEQLHSNDEGVKNC